MDNKPTAGEVTADLRRRILDGRRPDGAADAIPPGGRLPSASDLARDYGFARATATAIVGQLKSEGLVTTGPGGTIAMDTSKLWIRRSTALDRSVREATDLTSVEAACAERGMTSWTVHHYGHGPGPDYATEAFGMEPGAGLHHLWGENWVRLPSETGTFEHVALTYDTWLAPEVAERIPQLNEPRTDENRSLWRGGVYSAVERGLGIRLDRRPLDILGRTSTPEEAERMGLGAPGPVMAELFVATCQGVPYIVDLNVYRFGTVVWRFEVPIGG